MTRAAAHASQWPFQRCHIAAASVPAWRSVLLASCLVMVLSVSMYPGLWSIGVRLCSVFTGSYVHGHHSVVLINSPNAQAAKDIGRAIMARRLAASVNILSKTSTMYYWKGDIQEASEVLMVSLLEHVLPRVRQERRAVRNEVWLLFQLVKTKTSRIQQVTDCVRSLHPYANPEVLSFLVEDGSPPYMKWMDEAVPED